jgi:hypothetical protein
MKIKRQELLEGPWNDIENPNHSGDQMESICESRDLDLKQQRSYYVTFLRYPPGYHLILDISRHFRVSIDQFEQDLITLPRFCYKLLKVLVDSELHSTNVRMPSQITLRRDFRRRLTAASRSSVPFLQLKDLPRCLV